MCLQPALTCQQSHHKAHNPSSLQLASLARNSLCNARAGSRKTLRSALEFRLQLQRAVSMNKRRFFDTGGGGAGRRLDLDLTYVCDRLIAMAIPCVEGAVYRNDIREVSGWLGGRLRQFGAWLSSWA